MLDCAKSKIFLNLDILTLKGVMVDALLRRWLVLYIARYEPAGWPMLILVPINEVHACTSLSLSTSRLAGGEGPVFV